jgi:3-deoxy-D-manno-octulosonic-acid transferase
MMERVASRLYDGAMQVAAGTAALAAALPGAPSRWRGAADRLGRLGPVDRAAVGSGPVLWFHAASVGELRAVRPLLGTLRARRPGRVVLVSTLTRTGLTLARDLAEVDAATLLPLDAHGTVRTLLDGVALEAFCFTETEIWPTVLAEVAERGAPAFMVSGRVSPRTAARGRWLRPLYARALAEVVCCMQTADDATRVITLGADPARVHVAGSLKFEHVASDIPEGVRALASRLGARPVLVAGSTHDGEESVLLDAHARLVEHHPGLVLVLAPRHPERLEAVGLLVRDRGAALVSYRALTTGPAMVPEGGAVVLLDVMGPLAHCYALGVAAFVGGSLVPIGGHNVLEPARAARPVLVGPHTASVEDVVARLLSAGGARRVRSADDLVMAMRSLLDDPEVGREMGRRARDAIAVGEGALARHLAVIEARLGPPPARAATA